MDSVYAAVLILVLLAGLGWVVLEMRLRALRTKVLQIPGGLRFEAQDFSVQVLRKEQQLCVHYVRGVWTPPVLGAVQSVAKNGRTECTFAAIGFRVEVYESVTQESGQDTPTHSDRFGISMRGANESQLVLHPVNGTVAQSFKLFFLQVGHWIERLEWRAEQARVERLRSEEAAAQAQEHAQLLAQLLGNSASKEPRTQAERDRIAATQIAQWRQAAGFVGKHSLHASDANGMVLWFVDLAEDGRVTLHADKRTIHSTLRGARIASMGNELEVGVRDAYWTEEEPELRTFKLLQGVPANERRVWKDRLEVSRANMSARPQA